MNLSVRASRLRSPFVSVNRGFIYCGTYSSFVVVVATSLVPTARGPGSFQRWGTAKVQVKERYSRTPIIWSGLSIEEKGKQNSRDSRDNERTEGVRVKSRKNQGDVKES